MGNQISVTVKISELILKTLLQDLCSTGKNTAKVVDLFRTYLFGWIVSLLYGTLLVVFTDNF